MASRPAWKTEDIIKCEEFEFVWNGGFAKVQKEKNITNLHAAIKEKYDEKVLEVSTKSSVELGQKLSAFNLKLDGYYLENIFQSSKVYKYGGPYTDMLDMPPKDAKRDERHKTSGQLIKFSYKDQSWDLLPQTAFYDYIYILAALECLNEEDKKELICYDWFTDIEFNPKKSINCQARSTALFKRIIIDNNYDVLKDKQGFIKFHCSAIR